MEIGNSNVDSIYKLSEIISISSIKDIKKSLGIILHATVYELIAEGVICVSEKKIKTNDYSHATSYFLRLSKSSHDIERDCDIVDYEMEILQILPKDTSWISVKEFTFYLSHFTSPYFRALSKPSRIEIHIIKELQKKGLVKIKYFKLLILKIYYANKLSSLGRELLLDKEMIQRETLFLNDRIRYFQIFYPFDTFICSENFIRFDFSFRKYYTHWVDNTKEVVASPIYFMNSYPEIADKG